jgi:hypothetical protein
LEIHQRIGNRLKAHLRQSKKEGESMSRYVAKIIGPSGMESYLMRGREVECADNATHYSHPSAARVAIRNYMLRNYPNKYQRPIADVIDTRDPERTIA